MLSWQIIYSFLYFSNGYLIPQKLHKLNNNVINTATYFIKSSTTSTLLYGVTADMNEINIENLNNYEINDLGETKPLTLQERISRSLSFYATAVPVFGSYKLLEIVNKFKRETLNYNISIEEEEEEYQKLHDWGSEQLVEKIKELKGCVSLSLKILLL